MTCGHGNFAVAEQSGRSKLFDHLRLALEDEHVRAPQRAHVERLVTRVQDENLLHRGRKVPDQATRIRAAFGRPAGYRPMARSTASCSSGESATDGLPRSSSFM